MIHEYGDKYTIIFLLIVAFISSCFAGVISDQISELNEEIEQRKFEENYAVFEKAWRENFTYESWLVFFKDARKQDYHDEGLNVLDRRMRVFLIDEKRRLSKEEYAKKLLRIEERRKEFARIEERRLK